jgi:hypothetical protein
MFATQALGVCVPSVQTLSPQNTLNNTFLEHTHQHNIKKKGTPGGDLAELAAGAAAYLNATGGNANATGGNANASALALARDVVNEFVASGVVTKKRPLYLHTSDEKLRSVFKAAYEAGVRPKPTVLPLV